jgi:hypothetical protein
MFQWLCPTRRQKSHDDVLVIRLLPKSVARLRTLLSISAWRKEMELINEALLVVETIYNQSKLNRNVICAVEHGKIVMYVDPDDDGDGLPQPVDSDGKVVDMLRFKRAA